MLLKCQPLFLTLFGPHLAKISTNKKYRPTANGRYIDLAGSPVWNHIVHFCPRQALQHPAQGGLPRTLLGLNNRVDSMHPWASAMHFMFKTVNATQESVLVYSRAALGRESISSTKPLGYGTYYSIFDTRHIGEIL